MSDLLMIRLELSQFHWYEFLDVRMIRKLWRRLGSAFQGKKVSRHAVPTVSDVVQQLLPSGSRGVQGDISQPPYWPPDIYAVCAYLLQETDAYTFLLHHEEGGMGGKLDRIRDELEIFGEYLSCYAKPDDELGGEISKLWSAVALSEVELRSCARNADWALNAVKLLIISDHACAGIGFCKWPEEKMMWVPALYSLINSGRISDDEVCKWFSYGEDNVFSFMHRMARKSGEISEGELRATACIMVPPEIACVHPKSRTTMVGCTLRSLTHHLSLHPSSGQIKSSWMMPESAHANDRQNFNILVIPYPYQIEAESFIGAQVRGRSFGLFDIDQTWLKRECLPGETLLAAVDRLISAAEAKSGFGVIDAIVFPEAALDGKWLNIIKEHICNRFKDRQIILIAGVLDGGDNFVYCSLLGGGREVSYQQRKHHRWGLDGRQISDYGLEMRLNPNVKWWENIKVDHRELNYFLYRSGSCLATLICEDLARTDPCQASIRAIGPNLLIALLMDGPQLRGRWPERYAMGLADDPGTSVLSVTSVGLIRRSNKKYGTSASTVGLWRDCISGSKELSLDFGDHALLLELESISQAEETLDGRSDGQMSQSWTLTKVIGLT